MYIYIYTCECCINIVLMQEREQFPSCIARHEYIRTYTSSIVTCLHACAYTNTRLPCRSQSWLKFHTHYLYQVKASAEFIVWSNHCVVKSLCGQIIVWSNHCVVNSLSGQSIVWSNNCLIRSFFGQSIVCSIHCLVKALPGPIIVWSIHCLVKALPGPIIAWSIHCLVKALSGPIIVWSIHCLVKSLSGPIIVWSIHCLVKSLFGQILSGQFTVWSWSCQSIVWSKHPHRPRILTQKSVAHLEERSDHVGIVVHARSTHCTESICA